jgi:hypothetical protein
MKSFPMFKRFLVFTFVTASVLFTAASASAQAGGAAPATSDPALRGAFPTTLAKSLDSKKLKEGDTVICQTSAPIRSHGMMIPTGAKVTGHVTQAQAKSKGDSQSSLAMVFDKIEVTKGKELPMKGTLQAIAPALGKGGADTASMMGSGQMMAGHGDSSTMPANGGAVGPGPGVASTPGVRPILNAQSLGVLGFKNMEMDKDSVITSSGKEIKLEDGTQMMLRSEIQFPVQ